MKYRAIINKGASILKDNMILTANIDAELLLSKIVSISREKILLNLESELNQDKIEEYINLINRRIKKEPVSQITGKKFFWKDEFVVNKNVLTPRFETELLVEEVIKSFKHISNIRVLDAGVGSGCILISLLSEKKNWRGVGVDISRLALKTARTNAKIQQIENRIRFIHSDIDKFSGNKYDLVVSNPPYISKVGYSSLDTSVRCFEPKMALYGGIDGFRIIEKVIKKSKLILKNNGSILMEIGLGQHYNTCKILKNNGFYILKTIKDYQKIKRCIFAKKIK